MPNIEWGEPGDGGYAIGELVALTGVPSSSIHHYLRSGLIPEPKRVAANRFVYDDRHIAALSIVRSLRERGRTLRDIAIDLPRLWHTEADLSNGAVDAYLLAAGEEGTRARIVDAAIGAFAERGYRDISVDGLCRRAGVAKGTFYRHFKSKDELFLTAASVVVERAIGDFAREMKTSGREDHHALFAEHLRHGLPVLLELAKRAVQDSGPTVHAAAELFMGLAERLGNVVGDEDDAAQAGGFVIVLAVVEIFGQLFEADVNEAADSQAPDS